MLAFRPDEETNKVYSETTDLIDYWKGLKWCPLVCSLCFNRAGKNNKSAHRNRSKHVMDDAPLILWSTWLGSGRSILIGVVSLPGSLWQSMFHTRAGKHCPRSCSQIRKSQDLKFATRSSHWRFLWCIHPMKLIIHVCCFLLFVPPFKRGCFFLLELKKMLGLLGAVAVNLKRLYWICVYLRQRWFVGHY